MRLNADAAVEERRTPCVPMNKPSTTRRREREGQAERCGGLGRARRTVSNRHKRPRRHELVLADAEAEAPRRLRDESNRGSAPRSGERALRGCAPIDPETQPAPQSTSRATCISSGAGIVVEPSGVDPSLSLDVNRSIRCSVNVEAAVPTESPSRAGTSALNLNASSVPATLARAASISARIWATRSTGAVRSPDGSTPRPPVPPRSSRSAPVTPTTATWRDP